MIANLDKFQYNITERVQVKLTCNVKKSTSILLKPQRVWSFYVLCIKIDNQLNFESNVSKICKKAPGQLNALSRLKSFLNQDQRNVFPNSFIYSNFDCCSQRLMNKIKNIQKLTQQFVLNDYTPTTKHY